MLCITHRMDTFISCETIPIFMTAVIGACGWFFKSFITEIRENKERMIAHTAECNASIIMMQKHQEEIVRMWDKTNDRLQALEDQGSIPVRIIQDRLQRIESAIAKIEGQLPTTD
jgi:hypothetical protein